MGYPFAIDFHRRSMPSGFGRPSRKLGDWEFARGGPQKLARHSVELELAASRLRDVSLVLKPDRLGRTTKRGAALKAKRRAVSRMPKKRTENVRVSFTESQWQMVREAAEASGETVNQFFRNIALDWARCYADSEAYEKREAAKQRMILAS